MTGRGGAATAAEALWHWLRSTAWSSLRSIAARRHRGSGAGRGLASLEEEAWRRFGASLGSAVLGWRAEVSVAGKHEDRLSVINPF